MPTRPEKYHRVGNLALVIESDENSSLENICQPTAEITRGRKFDVKFQSRKPARIGDGVTVQDRKPLHSRALAASANSSHQCTEHRQLNSRD